MNDTGKQKGPDSASCQGLTGHSPALARLFLVGLRPRRARLRFTVKNQYRTGEERTERKRRLHRPFPWEEALADADASLSVPVDSALVAERHSD
jgi:hypothetical protein